MSAPAVRPSLAKKPALPDAETSETRFWRQLKAPLLIKENNSVNHIHFSPANPHDLAFTSSTKIQILDSKTHQVQKTIAKFKDNVYSGEFRFDGRLIGAGDATGLIQCFDTNTKAVLVTLKPTSHPVHVVKFHPTSKSTMLSASDDRVVRLWDLTASDPVMEIKQGHEDYIRTAAFVGSSNLIASGCYDGKVRLFDSRSPEIVAEFDQKDPVESVLPLNDNVLASSGGPNVKIWDLAAGKQRNTLGNFQKTVTCLVSAGEKGLLAGSLDGHVKVFDSNDPAFPVKFGWKYGGPVISTAISPDLRQLATGLTTGLLSVRTRKTEPKTPAKQKQAKTLNKTHITRGAEYKGELESQVIKIAQKPLIASKIKLFERHIKAFKWSEALDCAFKPGVAIEQTLTILEELRFRGKIEASLQNRDEFQLTPLLKWCVKHISNARLVDIISDYIGCLVSLHSTSIESSPALTSLVDNLQSKISIQVDRAREAQSLEGMIELLMA